MTLIEDLRTHVEYPLGDNVLESVLIKRELDKDTNQTAIIARSSSFRGAIADLLVRIINAPNISEGGVSISLSDKDKMLKVANSIYLEIGEPEIGEKKPSVTIE